MELDGLKLDDLIVSNPFLKERVLVNKCVNFFSSFDSSHDDAASSWHPRSGNE
jgi:hypothetical protein